MGRHPINPVCAGVDPLHPRELPVRSGLPRRRLRQRRGRTRADPGRCAGRTTGERPVDGFERDERGVLKPLAHQPYCARRGAAPRQMPRIDVEHYPLRDYAEQVDFAFQASIKRDQMESWRRAAGRRSPPISMWAIFDRHRWKIRSPLTRSRPVTTSGGVLRAAAESGSDGAQCGIRASGGQRFGKKKADDGVVMRRYGAPITWSPFGDVAGQKPGVMASPAFR